MINFRQSFFILIILLGGCKTSKDVASSVDGGQSIPALIVQDNYKQKPKTMDCSILIK